MVRKGESVVEGGAFQILGEIGFTWGGQREDKKKSSGDLIGNCEKGLGGDGKDGGGGEAQRARERFTGRGLTRDGG